MEPSNRGMAKSLPPACAESRNHRNMAFFAVSFLQFPQKGHFAHKSFRLRSMNALCPQV
jgi:hypothetical protein